MVIDNFKNYQLAERGAWLGIITNIFLAALKIIVGIFGRSFALITDGFHSCSDCTSSAAVLFGLIIASKPKDKRHPYGHGKAESLASMNIVILLVFFALLMAWKSVVSLFQKELLQQPALITLWIALISVFLKEALYRYKMRLGKRLKSTSLIADAWHHRSDAFSSIVVVIGIAGAVFGGNKWWFLDRVAALIVSCTIIYIGVKIYIRAASELMDESVDLDMVRLVKNKAKQVKGVKDIETLIVRKAGLDFLVDIHVEVDSELNVNESHRISAEVRNKIMDGVPQVKSVLVHIEPYFPGNH